MMPVLGVNRDVVVQMRLHQPVIYGALPIPITLFTSSGIHEATPPCDEH